MGGALATDVYRLTFIALKYGRKGIALAMKLAGTLYTNPKAQRVFGSQYSFPNRQRSKRHETIYSFSLCVGRSSIGNGAGSRGLQQVSPCDWGSSDRNQHKGQRGLSLYRPQRYSDMLGIRL